MSGSAERPAGRPHRVEWVAAARLGLMTVLFGLALLLVPSVIVAAGCRSPASSPTVSAGSTASIGGPPVSSAGAARLEKLTLVAPPGPLALPLAYIAVNDRLSDVAAQTELVIWENADQLRAIVAGGQGDFISMPSNNAAIFYNKGLVLRLLDITVWNITYLITTDPGAASFSDIEGRSLAVSLPGSVPDVMFRYIAAKEGLDPQDDFELRYAADPTQAAQLLLSGQVDNAVLSEALATAVIAQSSSSARPLYRALAFDEAWAKAAGKAAPSPIAGTVVTARVIERPDVVAAFTREYRAAVEWMLANPEEAGRLVERSLHQLGLEAALMTASLRTITWRYTPALEARASLEAFYLALAELSPEIIGGKLPDDGFYHTP